MHTGHTRSRHGFTLFELAITLVVASLIMALGLAGTSDMVIKHRALQDATRFMMDARKARTTAMKSKSPVKIALSNQQVTMRLASAGCATEQSLLSQTRLSAQGTSTPLVVCFNPANGAATVLNPTTGLPVPGAGQTVFSGADGTAMFHVDVTPAGIVSTGSGQNGAVLPGASEEIGNIGGSVAADAAH